MQERSVLRSLLRNDFKYFLRKAFAEVSPGDEFLGNWHIEYICNALMDMGEGNNNRLIINIPPRYLKSIICSVALPAWLLGQDPKATIIAVSYSDELSEKFALNCRRVMEAAWYKDLFPMSRLSKTSVNNFETTHGGGRFSTSVGGTLTGIGADWIIVDDPIKPQDANSDVMRDKVNEWFSTTLYSRLNDKRQGKILLIMQRVHENDLTGYLESKGLGFKHIRLPAIAEEDEKWKIVNHLSGNCKSVVRKQGEALHPARESLELLEGIKNAIGDFVFAGQYQQTPVPREGGLIKKEWFHYYNKQDFLSRLKEQGVKLKLVLQSWDTANKTAENNDYSCCATFAKDEAGLVYLLEVKRFKLDFPGLVKRVVEEYNALKIDFQELTDSSKMLIEDKASGTQLIQILKKDYEFYPEVAKPELDKVSRMLKIAHLVETGKCLFPEETLSWKAGFEKELLTFPKSKFDDQCDAFSQGLSFAAKFTNDFVVATIPHSRENWGKDLYW